MCMAVIASSATLHAAKPWESTRNERFTEGRIVTRTTEIEISTLPGVIMINTSKPMQVKVFSVLGQLVSSATIPSGVSQLNLGTHGVFIVKAGDVTCKVAL